jgi:hypothetical protein
MVTLQFLLTIPQQQHKMNQSIIWANMIWGECELCGKIWNGADTRKIICLPWDAFLASLLSRVISQSASHFSSRAASVCIAIVSVRVLSAKVEMTKWHNIKMYVWVRNSLSDWLWWNLFVLLVFSLLFFRTSKIPKWGLGILFNLFLYTRFDLFSLSF